MTTCNIVISKDGITKESHSIINVNAMFYSETDDMFRIHSNGACVAAFRMGDILEMETYIE